MRGIDGQWSGPRIVNREGHVGLTLAVTSLMLQAIDVELQKGVLLILLLSFLSVLPNIDLRLKIKHRKYTHNVFVAIPASTLLGLLTNHVGLGLLIGFTVCLLGFLCHILGDLLTYSSFPPLWPAVKREVSLKLFKSSDKVVNSFFMFVGLLSFLLFLLNAIS